MLLTGADIIVECLKEQKVDTIFGYPGGAVLNIYDSLYKNKEYIKHIRTSHEQAAAHAADGYARATGKVGVCLATSGPGATNLVTGIATAYMDSVPMVAITGNVPVALLGKDSFQEVDIAGVTMPITKHNYIVKDVNDLAETIREAFYIAKEGRPGPVLIDIPKDVTANMAEYVEQEPKEIKRNIDYITEKDLNKAIEILNDCERPFILMGGGVIKSNANNELKEFAEKINAPVTSTLMGLGGFPGEHEYFTGMLGMHGTKASNVGITKSDVIIVIGARFSDRVVSKVEKFVPKAKVLHIDVDPAEIDKNVTSHYNIIGDVKEVLNRLNESLEQADRKEWIAKIVDLKVKYPLKYNENALTAQYVIEKLYEVTKGDAIISTEVGQHQMWAAQFFKYNQPDTFVTSGGLGTMGFGLGASIGAMVGCPHKKVINIAGDGSFRMNLNELLTVVEYKLPLVQLVINNSALGMVRQWQTLFYEGRYAQTQVTDGIDYVMLAKSFGMKAVNLTSKEQVEETLKEAIESNEPILINCIVDKDDKVFPMVSPGGSIEDLMTE